MQRRQGIIVLGGDGALESRQGLGDCPTWPMPLVISRRAP